MGAAAVENTIPSLWALKLLGCVVDDRKRMTVDILEQQRDKRFSVSRGGSCDTDRASAYA